jgi:hypothetical protein
MKMATVSVIGNNVSNCLSAARKVLGIPYKGNEEIFRNEGEPGEGLYRCELAGGDIVEVTLAKRTACVAEIVD